MKKAVPTSFEFTIGSIETTEHKERSKITFYDKNLNQVQEQEVKYAGLGSHWLDPIYQGESVYFISEGLLVTGRGDNVIQIDLKNGKEHAYKFDRVNIQSTAVKDDKIILVSNLNAISYLSIYDKKNKKKLQEVSYDRTYVSLVVSANNKIYSFCNEMKDDGERIVFVAIYDMELNELAKKKLTNMAHSHSKYNVIGNKLYFTFQSIEKEEENGIGILDLVSDELEKVV